MAINPNPSSILHKVVTFDTVLSDGSTISEGHQIYGPYGQDLVISTLSTGSKKVIALTENTGEGAHFLKLHFPTSIDPNSTSDSSLYITYCRKDSSYPDGYRDFETNVSTAFLDDLAKWIDNGRNPTGFPNVRTREITFTGVGRETAQVNNSKTFKVKFFRTVSQGGTNWAESNPDTILSSESVNNATGTVK